MNENVILEGYPDLEKGAYLCAIASMATADRVASDEELEYLDALSQGANLSEEQSNLIRQTATTELSDEDLKRCLDVLKTSELRFSLVSDVIAFAQADKDFSVGEKAKLQQMASYLGVNAEQYSVLDEFTRKAVQEAPRQEEQLASGADSTNNFFSSLGLGDKLKNAGINTNSLLKGALGILGPLFLARMFTNRNRNQGSGIGGMFGGGRGLGGLLSGGGLLGGLLGGGRGFGGLGGMLGRLFGRN